ncbi:MAG: dienelactone hydrolase family protein [Acidimicrobiia bacterium]
MPKAADWTRSCPIVASFGGRDRLVRHRGQELRPALDLAGIANDIKCYEHSRHSFLTESKVGWQSMLLGLRHDPAAARRCLAADGALPPSPPPIHSCVTWRSPDESIWPPLFTQE